MELVCFIMDGIKCIGFVIRLGRLIWNFVKVFFVNLNIV